MTPRGNARPRMVCLAGEILEYTDNINLLANLKRFWAYKRDDRVKLDGLLGTAPNTGAGALQYQNRPGAGTHVACIPMSLLLGIFDSRTQYMPASMCAGMKVEVELSPLQIITTTFATGGIQISAMKPTLLLDSAQLYDVVNKQLLEEQADVDESGIQFTYKTYFNSAAVTASNAVNIDIQQSASLVSEIIAITRDNNVVSSGFNGADAFDYIQPFSQAQYRLGSLYWPQQIINVPTGTTWPVTQNNSQEWYGISLTAFQAYVDEFHKAAGGEATCQFQAASVASDLSLNSWTIGKPCLAFTGEKSACGLELTGEPTNNSRILNFSATIGQATGSGAFPGAGPLVPPYAYTLAQVRVDTFLAYTRVANLMGDNCVVDR